MLHEPHEIATGSDDSGLSLTSSIHRIAVAVTSCLWSSCSVVLIPMFCLFYETSASSGGQGWGSRPGIGAASLLGLGERP